MSRTKSPPTPEPFRLCSGPCGRMLELNSDNFPVHKTCRNGFNRRCRKCVIVANRISERRRSERVKKAKLLTAPALKPGERCRACEGLAHRRPLAGCPRCGLPHVPEPKVEPVLRKFEVAS
jgi:hypothetical protein